MREPTLAPKQMVDTTFGRIATLQSGPADGPAVLFVHGIPTSGYLWRHVVRLLDDDLLCIAPDLMGLGDTEVDPEDTNFDMESQAEMLLELMEVLGHDRYALVAHDQGGAAAQIIATRLPERVTRLVLTDCVCYDNWPVPAIARLQRLSAIRPLSELFVRSGLAQWFETSTPLSAFRRGVYQKDRLARETIAEYLRPLRSGPAARERFRQFLLAGHPRFTARLADGLRQLQVPTLIAWAGDDAYISPSWGRRLFEEIPGAARFELVGFAGHFWPEEKPAEFASLFREFLLATTAEAEVPAESSATEVAA